MLSYYEFSSTLRSIYAGDLLLYLKNKSLQARVADKMLVHSAPYCTEPKLPSDVIAHLCDAAAGYHDGNAHLGGFDDHLAGQAACGVEGVGLIFFSGLLAVDPLHRHPAGECVDGVVAAYIFDEHQHLSPFEERAAMHAAGAFVGALLLANRFRDAVELGLGELGGRELDLVNLVHQTTKNATLAAACGDDFFGSALFNFVDASASFHGG
jgi:hypothetical protein